jgi:growth factor-regulated tyrosine kinase substrate
VKNAGDPFLVEIASREFIDNLVSILKIPTLNGDVKNMVLRLVQNWSTAFEGKSSLSYVGQVCETLKKEGELGLALGFLRRDAEVGARVQIPAKGLDPR